MKRMALFSLLVLCKSVLFAQMPDDTLLNSDSISTTFSASLSRLRQEIFKDSVPSEGDIDPYLYRMLIPTTYYSNITKDILSLEDTIDETQSKVAAIMSDFYVRHPEKLKYYDSDFQNETLIEPAKDTPTKDDIKEVIDDIAKQEDISKIDSDIEIGMKIKKPNFWKFSGESKLTFQQNYISDNWYKGGNNNGTMLAEVRLYANYNDTKRITWENKLDMRLGYITSSADTCHTFNTNNDRLNFYSKINVKKSKTWSYTCTFDAVTQFLPGYRTNMKDPFSNFLAPLDATTSLGFDLRPSVKKGSISIALLPLSYKFRLIETDEANIHNTYGQQEDFRQDWGSRIEFNTNFTLAKDLTWRCRFYGFTSYKYVESELENNFDYKLSRFITASFNALFRFDDNRPQHTKDTKLGYFQLKEYLTFGLSYSF